jgi:hypothetical protein
VLRNLGQAELKTGHYLEAARHLSTFVRETTYGTPAEREAAARSLTLAEAQVGRVFVTVDVAGAEVTVDGELAGRTPIADPFYAEPGERTIRIQKEGFTTYETTQVIEAARTTQLKITLALAGEPTPAASVSRTSGVLDAPSDIAPSVADAVGPPPPGLVPASDGVSARTVVLVTTGGLALASAGVWLGFALRGASLQRRADELLAEATGAPGGAACANPSALCNELRDVSDQRASANTIALAGGIATGVAAGAFAATWFFWPKRSHAAAPLALVPSWAPDHAGLEFRGDF